jgi:putative NADPH-quinone reductase
MEIAYRFVANDKGEGAPVGMLKAKAAVVFNTANTPEDREREIFGDPLEGLWKKCVFDLCGVRNVHRRTFSVVITSTPPQRAEWLREVGETVARYFPRTADSVGETPTDATERSEQQQAGPQRCGLFALPESRE